MDFNIQGTADCALGFIFGCLQHESSERIEIQKNAGSHSHEIVIRGSPIDDMTRENNVNFQDYSLDEG